MHGPVRVNVTAHVIWREDGATDSGDDDFEIALDRSPGFAPQPMLQASGDAISFTFQS
jgi:hypothetical protein